MLSGELADISDPELWGSYTQTQVRVQRFNQLTLLSPEYREALEELIPGVPESVTICPPFYCDHGRNITLGEHVYINYNCNILDGTFVRIGAYTLIGPGTHIFTPQHPMDYRERRKPIERSLPVTIGEDCWIGGGVTICPGVTIGDRCIIAAGSVVVRDIPSDSLAVGNPAVVKRRLESDSR